MRWPNPQNHPRLSSRHLLLPELWICSELVLSQHAAEECKLGRQVPESTAQSHLLICHSFLYSVKVLLCAYCMQDKAWIAFKAFLLLSRQKCHKGKDIDKNTNGKYIRKNLRGVKHLLVRRKKKRFFSEEDIWE